MFKENPSYHNKPNFKPPKFLLPTQTTLIPNSDSNSDDERVPKPWPEWVEFMDCLSQNGYFHGFENPVLGKAGFDAKVGTGFARERVSLIGYFSRMDIQVVAGYGCPVIDRKVVNSGKRLRAHLGIDEENVCSSCSLRGSCERAYTKAHESDGGHTVDVMRLLLTYGLDHVSGKLENKVCNTERVFKSVRRLLKEMVEYLKEPNYDPQPADISNGNSLIEGVVHHRQRESNGWMCSRCKFVNLAGNINCVQCDGQKRKLGRDHNHIALKKGDWLCEK